MGDYLPTYDNYFEKQTSQTKKIWDNTVGCPQDNLTKIKDTNSP